MPWSGFRLILALAACIAMPRAEAKLPPPQVAGPVLRLDDFEAEPKGWKFVGGEEFPGAKGSLRRVIRPCRTAARAPPGSMPTSAAAGPTSGAGRTWSHWACPTSRSSGSGSGPRTWTGSACGSWTTRASAIRSASTCRPGRRTGGGRSSSRSATSSGASTGAAPTTARGTARRRASASTSARMRSAATRTAGRPSGSTTWSPWPRHPAGRRSAPPRSSPAPAGRDTGSADRVLLGRRAAGVELQRLRPLRRREGADGLPGRPRSPGPDEPLVRPGRIRPDGRRADRHPVGALRCRGRVLEPQARRARRRPPAVPDRRGAGGPPRRRLPHRVPGGRRGRAAAEASAPVSEARRLSAHLRRGLPGAVERLGLGPRHALDRPHALRGRLRRRRLRRDPARRASPFTVKDGVLQIEAKKVGGRWRSGLLCSVDPKGEGFSQKYGYFEMRAKFPKGLGTWPAFWLMGVPQLKESKDRKTLTQVEIDVVEQYGVGPNALHTTLHLWGPGDFHWAEGDTPLDRLGHAGRLPLIRRPRRGGLHPVLFRRRRTP